MSPAFWMFDSPSTRVSPVSWVSLGCPPRSPHHIRVSPASWCPWVSPEMSSPIRVLPASWVFDHHIRVSPASWVSLGVPQNIFTNTGIPRFLGVRFTIHTGVPRFLGVLGCPPKYLHHIRVPPASWVFDSPSIRVSPASWVSRSSRIFLSTKPPSLSSAATMGVFFGSHRRIHLSPWCALRAQWVFFTAT